LFFIENFERGEALYQKNEAYVPPCLHVAYNTNAFVMTYEE